MRISSDLIQACQTAFTTQIEFKQICCIMNSFIHLSFLMLDDFHALTALNN